MKRILKKIYDLLPLKIYIFRVLRLFPVPEKLFEHLHFKGLITIPVAGKSFQMYHYGFLLENEIFWKGIEGWERTSLKIWIELSKKSNCIIDIGANTGLFALLSKTVNADANVVAFEPVLRVFEKLQRNIAVNKFSVVAECKGLSNYTGDATIYDLPTDHIYSVTINENTNPAGLDVIPTVVSVTTLDEYQVLHNLLKIDLIKMDVETHEPAVLEGMLAIVARDLPALIIEVLNDTVANKVNMLLAKFDYKYFLLDDVKGPISVPDIKKRGFKNYLACSVADEDYLRSALIISSE